jgi:hypothetical protein
MKNNRKTERKEMRYLNHIPRAAAALSLALALAACNGPWNMEPDTESRPVKLWASALLVADRPLDTLWLERPVSLGETRDPAAAFIDPAASEVYVTTGSDTLRFLPAPGTAAAWLPADTAHRVRRGARYHLFARVRWNAAAGFPRETSWRSEILRASTRVPETFSIDSVFQAPVEALHRSLSTGLPESTLRRAHSDAAYRSILYDSLAALPAGESFAAKVSRDAFASYLEGKAAFVPVRGGDTLHYIFDGSEAVEYTGRVQQRSSLPWLFTTRNDGPDFGGLILSQHFDSSRSRILDPVTAFALDAFGKDLDSAEYFQSGNVRPVLVAGPYYTGIKGYPDTLRLTNILLGYTGRTVLRGYATDPLYWEYYRGMWMTGTEQMSGLGGGNSRAQNALRVSNVENGDGYFCGAVADSIAFHVEAARDTLDNASLRAAWQAREAGKARRP